jgi:hypothetical protein
MHPTLTVRFISSLASWTWLENTAVGPVAFLLLAHPETGPASMELSGLADGLGLVPPGSYLPDTGERVILPSRNRAAVLVDGCRHLVEVEVGDRWHEFVHAGGPIALLVGLASLARCSPRDEVESYLGRAALGDQLRMGTARVRRESDRART